MCICIRSRVQDPADPRMTPFPLVVRTLRWRLLWDGRTCSDGRHTRHAPSICSHTLTPEPSEVPVPLLCPALTSSGLSMRACVRACSHTSLCTSFEPRSALCPHLAPLAHCSHHAPARALSRGQFDAVLLLLCITYGAQFGQAATAKMLTSWGMSYALQLVCIQPVQVAVIACAPCLFDDSHLLGRCLNRLRGIYNEYC